jgi:hypothetical protein
MKCLLAAAVLAVSLAHAAEPSIRDKWQLFQTTLEPKKMHEECVRLEKGETRRYLWKSDAPVDFNIHYHQEKEVFYPVKTSGMRADGGAFTAKSAEDYCWMWTARDKPAKLEGRIEAGETR